MATNCNPKVPEFSSSTPRMLIVGIGLPFSSGLACNLLGTPVTFHHRALSLMALLVNQLQFSRQFTMEFLARFAKTILEGPGRRSGSDSLDFHAFSEAPAGGGYLSSAPARLAARFTIKLSIRPRNRLIRWAFLSCVLIFAEPVKRRRARQGPRGARRRSGCRRLSRYGVPPYSPASRRIQLWQLGRTAHRLPGSARY